MSAVSGQVGSGWITQGDQGAGDSAGSLGQGQSYGAPRTIPLARALEAGAILAGTLAPVAVRKYDERRRFVVDTAVLVATPTLLIARGAPGRRFITADGTRYPATISLEYFPAGRWYNVLSLFDAATGALERHFCNILAPAEWDGTTLQYIDLDLDLVVTPDGRAIVEDVGDFRRNARAWRYPPAVRRAAVGALRELRALAVASRPPFTGETYPVAEARALAGSLVWGREAGAGDARPGA